jgi:hypothetical protein
MMNKSFANHEIVTLAVYILGGESMEIDTENIAIKVNELAPGRFTWHKYKDQINIENVRTFLSDAKKIKNGSYLLGSGKKGWLLTERGVAFSKQHLKELTDTNLARTSLSQEERRWIQREKMRMLSHPVMSKFMAQGPDIITPQEAESFFRVDDYVTGTAREKKIVRILNTFRDNPEIGQVVIILAGKVPMK